MSFNSRIITAFLLVLVLSSQVRAMTVYDVIQLSKKNYSDQDIVALIEVTDSAFALQADDISNLIDLGISDVVIQAMLKALPAEPPPESAPASNQGGYGTDSGNLTATVDLPPAKPVARANVNSASLQELDSGHHQHRMITLSGISLFVLRHEGSFSSVNARARAVVANLRAASTIENGEFQSIHANGSETIVFNSVGTARSVTIAKVSAQDAFAYQQRSGRRVTPDLLAAYWSDLLNDYWLIALDGQPPQHLVSLHEGEALQELYAGLDSTIDIDAERLVNAFQSLPGEEQEHLTRLAMTVPTDFEASNEHSGESP